MNMKQNKHITFARLLRVTMVMMIVMALLLCGCGKKDAEEPEEIKGIVLGDGDGKLEAQDMVDGSTKLYGQLLNSLTGNGSAAGESMGGEISVSVTFGDDLKDTVGWMLSMNGMESDLEWLKSVEMVMAAYSEGDLMQTVMAAKLNGKQIVSMDMIMDMANNMVYMGVPELNGQYMGAEVDMSEMESANASMQEMMAEMAQYADQLPTEQELNAVMTKYLNVALEALGEPAVTTEKLSHGGVSQNVTVSTYTIRYSDVIAISEQVLKAAQNDKDLEKVLDKFSKVYNESGAQQAAEMGTTWENVDLYEEMVAGIPEALDAIAQQKDALTEDFDLMIFTTYTDGDTQVGFKVVHQAVVDYTYEEEFDAISDTYITTYIPVYGEVESYYYGLRDGSDTAFVMSMGNGEMRLEGTGTEKNNLANGIYTLIAMDEEVMDIEVVNFDTNALRQGSLKGTLRLIPSEDLMESAAGMSAFIAEPVLELVMDVEADAATVSMNLLDDDDLFIGVTYSMRAVSNADIKVPNSYAKADDETDMQMWLMNMDLDQLLENLEKAGVPDDWMELLEDSMNMYG